MIHRRDFLRKGAICTGAAALGAQVSTEARSESEPPASGYSYRRPSFKRGMSS